ncbi:MAG: D-glycero-beta-D-manno-heptose 1-phosphate adenylyltransferase [Bacteriovoracaceae bacterium]|nr:D-glycero-beta-D-manno-heptose 1-phosphate adenylyltransferase [Bacteriovoracaceae bacterium]
MNLSKTTLKFLEENRDKRIVFTNGCFDILHTGHITYLLEARAQGDLLFIGLNSDASVKRLKGEKRPINSQEERKYILENLKPVDCVEVFEEDTPLELIKAVNPSVLVKGGDWPIDQIVGYEHVLANGGEVKSLIFVDGFSTTGTIEKILSS